MKKVSQTVTLLTTLGLVTTTTNIIKADDVSGEKSEVKAENVKQAVTQADVSVAEVNLTEANQKAEKQEQVVEHAQKEVAQAEVAVTNGVEKVLQAEQLANEATPENIRKAEEAIEQDNRDVAKAEEKLATSQKQQEAAQAEVTKQEKSVQEVQKAVDTKEAAVSEAEEKLAEKQAILDGTGSKEVLEKAEQAQIKVDESKKAVASAIAELSEAKKADAKRATDLAKAEDNVRQAQIKVNESKANLEQKTNRSNQTATELKQSQEKFAKAQNDYNAINKIIITNEYVKNLTDYSKNYLELGTEAQKQLVSMADQLRSVNTFKENANDSEELLDTNNLSEETLRELSLFASDLINQIRTAFNTPETMVSVSAVKFADSVSKGYVTDNWSFDQTRKIGHDAKAVNNAARLFGLKTSNSDEEARGLQFYENMKTISGQSDRISLSEAKRKIYDSILDFMFNKYEYLHAESIAGLTTERVEYFGIAFSSRPSATSIHFLTVSDEQIIGKGFDKTIIPNSRTSADIISSYNQATNNLKVTEEANKIAQEEKIQAEYAQNNSNAELAQVTAQRDAIKAITFQTPSAQEKLNKAQDTLQTDEEANKKAQEALVQLNADVKVKQEALKEAQAELATKKADLAKAEANLKAEQEKLNTKEIALQTAEALVKENEMALSKNKDKLAESEVYLASLKNAPTKLQIAKSSLAEAKNDLAIKQANLVKEEAALSILKDKQAQAQSNYSKLSEAYQEVLEAERLLKLEMEKETIERFGGKSVAVIDETGRIVGYVNGRSESSSADISQDKTIKVTYHTVSSTKNLPSTGEKASIMGFLLGLVFLGISFMTKKEVK